MKIRILHLVIVLAGILECSYAAEKNDNSHKAELDKISEIADPEQKVLAYINYSIKRFTERPANVGAIYYNIAPEAGEYDSGIAPETISEPEIRKNYEARLRENEKKIELSNLSASLFKESIETLGIARLITLHEISESEESELLKLIKGIEGIFRKYENEP